MTDVEFIHRFETCRLDDFRHLDHIQLACAYIERDGPERALEALLAGLRRFAAAKGHPEKFHYTLTRAWLELILLARDRHPTARSAAALVGLCPDLADSRCMRRFYSEAALNTDAARGGWVPPDLAPFVERYNLA